MKALLVAAAFLFAGMATADDGPCPQYVKHSKAWKQCMKNGDWVAPGNAKGDKNPGSIGYDPGR